MRAILRGTAVLLAGAVSLAPASALAQEAPPPPTSNTPATDAVGPRELQNFSLSGNVTRPSDQPAPATAPPKQSSEASQPVADTTPAVSSPTPSEKQSRQTATAAQTHSPRAVSASLQQQPGTPALAPSPPIETAATPQPSIAPPSLPRTPTLTSERKLPIGPWLLAALALIGAISFLLWRRAPREALAGAPQFDLFKAAEPEPAPTAPEPVRTRPAAKPTPPAASGIVASRLRPSIELGVQPLRCTVEDSEVTIEFEIELYNAGTAPARAVLAEASLMNAGATQDKELVKFFANPVGAGERLDAIPPMRRVNFSSRVVAPRSAILEYDVAGRKAFVPVIAFNALYEWSGGKAQTSAAYLVGRETRGEKLGPLHLDLGPRAFTRLGARALPATVKT